MSALLENSRKKLFAVRAKRPRPHLDDKILTDWNGLMISALAKAGSTERRTLVVGRGISVQGTVQDAERLVVEGTVEATMINATELAISHGGVFKGEVQVEEAEIAGTIDGTLTVRDGLVVRSSGRVLGTARCKRLQVEDGGQITGRIEMLTGDSPSPKADAARMNSRTRHLT